jgi:hypothetical protein
VNRFFGGVWKKKKENMSKVQQFSESSQLLQKRKYIQIGSNDDPCEVLFGLHDIDEGETYRGIKIIPSQADLQLFKEFDEKQGDLQDLVKEHDDVEHVKVKVNINTVKVVNADKSVGSMDDVTNERQCKIIVCPRPWKMGEQQGVSMRVHSIQLIAEDMAIEFLE